MFEYDLCIIGGTTRKGLCWGLAFAQAGFSVVLYSEKNDEESFYQIKKGTMPYCEPYAQEMLISVFNKKLKMSFDKNVISKSRYCMISDDRLGKYETAHSRYQWQNLLQLLQAGVSASQTVIVEDPLFHSMTEVFKDYEIQNLVLCVADVHENTMIQDMHQNSLAIASHDGPEILKEVTSLFVCITDQLIRVPVAHVESLIQLPLTQPHKETQRAW